MFVQRIPTLGHELDTCLTYQYIEYKIILSLTHVQHFLDVIHDQQVSNMRYDFLFCMYTQHKQTLICTDG